MEGVGTPSPSLSHPQGSLVFPVALQCLQCEMDLVVCCCVVREIRLKAV